MSLQEVMNKQYKDPCKQLVKLLQDPDLERESAEFDFLTTFIKSIEYFKANVEAPMKLHDLAEAIRIHAKYEVHTKGTVLLKETQTTDKFCFVLKGTVQKWQQRPYDDVQKEFRVKNPKTMQVEHRKKDSNIHEYYSTVNTQRAKTPTAKGVRHAKTIGQLIEEPNEGERTELIQAYPEILGNVEDYTFPARRAATKMDFAHIVENNGYNESPNALMSINDVASLSSISSRGELSPHSPKTPKTPRSKAKMISFKAQTRVDRAQTMKSLDRKATLDLEELPLDKILPTTEEDIKFITEIAYQDPTIRTRCLVGNVLRIYKTGVYSQGEYFGENFEKQVQMKENCITIVSSEEAHLLTLSRDEYKVLRAEVFKQISKRAQVFCDIFTSLSDALVERFSHLFSSRVFKKNEIIYSQNDQTGDLYLLHSGDVKLTREVDISAQVPNNNGPIALTSRASRKVELPIAGVMANQFFGEEWLLRASHRQFTAVTKAANTIVYFVHYEALKANVESFDRVLKILADQAQEKFLWRQRRTQELLEQQQQQQQAKTSKPTAVPVIQNMSKVTSPTVKVMVQKGDKISGKTKDRVVIIRDSEPNIGDRNRGWEPRLNNNLTPTPKEDSSPQIKNLDIYKSKFTRKVAVMPASPLEAKIVIRQEPYSARGKAPTSIDELVGFSVRRELEDPKPAKTARLPKVPSSTNISPIRTDRNSANIFASQNATPARAETPKSLQIRIVKGPTHSMSLKAIELDREKTISPFILADFDETKSPVRQTRSKKPKPFLRSSTMMSTEALFKSFTERGGNASPANDTHLITSQRIIFNEEGMRKSSLKRNLVK